MSKLKGLAKIDLREEVDGCIAGLRSTDEIKVVWSAVHLTEGLAELVGSHLLPFVNRLGGELVSSIKKHKNIDELWNAAAAVCLAVGKSSARALCEPLMDLATHKDHLSYSVVAALRTFIAISGRLISPPVRSQLDYTIVGALYSFLIYRNHPDPDQFDADGHLMLLSDSVNLPYLIVDSPVKVHAAVILETAKNNTRLSLHTRTACSSARSSLDAQTHCRGAPIVTPTVDDIYKHLKKLGQGEDDTFETNNMTSLIGVIDPAVSEIQQAAIPAEVMAAVEKSDMFAPIAKSISEPEVTSRKRSRSPPHQIQQSVLTPLPILTPGVGSNQKQSSLGAPQAAVVAPVSIDWDKPVEKTSVSEPVVEAAAVEQATDEQAATPAGDDDDDMSSVSASSIELGEVDL